MLRLRNRGLRGKARRLLNVTRIVFERFFFGRVTPPLGRNNTAQAHLKQARQYLSNWEIMPALFEANRSIGARYMNGGAHRLHSNLLELLGDIEGARWAAQLAFYSDPLNPESYQLLQKHGLAREIAEGRAEIENEVAAHRWSPAAVLAACRCYLELGDPEAGEALLDRALARGVTIPTLDRTHVLGQLRLAQRDLEGAARQFKKLLGNEKHGLDAAYRLGECLMEMGQFAEAEEVIMQAQAGIDRNRVRGFNTTLYLTRFRQGDTRAAFLQARARGFTRALKEDVGCRYIQTLQDVGPDVRFCVVSDFGIGDEIRFASIYPDLSEQMKHLTVTCEPRLLGLFERSFQNIRFIPVKRWREETLTLDPESRAGMPSRRLTPHLDRAALDQIEAGDAFTSIFEMLADLRPNHAAFDGRAPYLKPDPERCRHWADYVATHGAQDRPNVALSWRSLLSRTVRNIHYLDPDDLAPLNAVKATYWIAQAGLTEAEVARIRAVLDHVQVVDELDFVDDFEGQAAFLKQMDVVVAPCTTLAELSGALGMPTLMFGRTLGATWRCRPDGRDVWFPSLEIVLGTPIGDKDAVVAALAEALSKKLT